MKVFSIVAIFLCVAAASAQLVAPSVDQVKEQILGQACAKLDQLIANLQNNSNPAIVALVNKLQAHLGEICHQRRVFDSLANMLGLGSVWDIISNLQSTASGLWSQLTGIMQQAITSGQLLWDSQLKHVFAQLVADLKGHAKDVIPIVTKYIPILMNALASGKRSVDVDMPIAFQRGILDFFGLSDLWANAMDVAAGAKLTLVTLLGQLMTYGKDVAAQALEVIKGLIAQLKDHSVASGPLFNNAIAALKEILTNAAANAISGGKRGILDFLGLNELWANAQDVAAASKLQLITLLGQLKNASKEVAAQVMAIITDLIAKLKDHSVASGPLFNNAIAAIKEILSNTMGGKRELAEIRGFWDSVASMFGLKEVWYTITHVAGNVKDQFFLILEKLLFAGKTAWSQAMPVFQDLVKNLKEHATNAGPLLTETIAKLTSIIANAGKRDLAEEEARGLLDFFGVSTILDNIKDFGAAAKENFMAVIAQITKAGFAAWAQALPILTSLKNDLLNHAADSKPHFDNAITALKNILANLGKRDLAERNVFIDMLEKHFNLSGIVSNIQSLSANLKAEFFKVLETLFFAGKDKWEQAKLIFNDLKAQLVGHANLAAPLFQNAIKELKEILGNHLGRRDLAVQRGVWDFFMTTLGVQAAIDKVTDVAGAAKDAFMVALQLLSQAGIKAWTEAIPVFTKLLTDLKLHATDGGVYVQMAIDSIKEIVKNSVGGLGKRSIFDFIGGHFTNIKDQIATIFQSNLAGLKEQVTAALALASTLVGQAKEQATLIINQLVKDLKEHAFDAKPYIENAIKQLQALIPFNGRRDIFDSVLPALMNAFSVLQNTLFANINIGDLAQEVLALVNQAGSLKGKFIEVLTQVLFAVQPIKQAAVNAIVAAFNEFKANPTSAFSIVSKLVKDLVALIQ
jgi:polyhydroxyalkanoate synthesis regulator phasin